MIIKSNYHTHTRLCKHASGEPADYCRSALFHQLEILGFSDHAALPDNRWPSVRMDIKDLETYSAMIDDAKKQFPELKILKGMECEFSGEYEKFYRDTLLGGLKFDYLIGAVHWFPFGDEWTNVYGGINSAEKLSAYADHFILTMKAGLFSFMVHPDVFGNCYLNWDIHCEKASRRMLEAAETFNVPLEINGYGFIKPPVQTSSGLRPMYPWLPFWELASGYKIRTIVNSDAHRPEDIIAGIQKGHEIAEKYNLRVIQSFEKP